MNKNPFKEKVTASQVPNTAPARYGFRSWMEAYEMLLDAALPGDSHVQLTEVLSANGRRWATDKPRPSREFSMDWLKARVLEEVYHKLPLRAHVETISALYHRWNVLGPAAVPLGYTDISTWLALAPIRKRED